MLGIGAALRRIQQSLDVLNWKVDRFMATQADLDAAVADIEAKVGALGTAADAIKAEIAALQQANPALDLSGLTKAVSDLDAAAATVAAIPPAPPAPPAPSA